jgi:hypothetical protein
MKTHKSSFQKSALSLKYFFTLIFSVSLLFPTLAVQKKSIKASKSYYFNSDFGNNKNQGSLNKPFKDLNKVSELKLNPGDSILLAAGNTFYGSLFLNDIRGTLNQPIVISSYVTNENKNRALIDAKGFYAGVLVENCSFVEIKNLVIQANGGGMINESDKDRDMRCGILVQATKSGLYEHVGITGVTVKDIFYENPGFIRDKNETNTANGTQRYGWGIRFINNTKDGLLKDISVKNCEISNTSHTGIKLTARIKGIENIEISDSKVSNVGGPGMQMSGVYKGIVRNNVVNGSGSANDTRNWARGSGLWTWSTSDVVIEKNQFLNAKGPGDSAGAHIDFNCNNVIMQYNLSVNNAGGFCEILGNNYNCAYRYNVSINDGWRVKKVDGAFQEGKIFWLSGYCSNGPKGPFNSYFYNNTIYVKKEIVAKVAVARTSAGICVTNNIFVIEGNSSEVQGDQYVPDKKGKVAVKDVFFENNLYLNENNWPTSILIKDNSPVYGNPGFVNAGGLKLTDYIPTNIDLIKDKGIEIPKIPGDSIGLVLGLKVERDILGNKITGKPDMGAIEITK